MEDEIVCRCKRGISPKLPFLIENSDDSTLKKYFNAASSDTGGEDANVSISIAEKNAVLKLILEKTKTSGATRAWWLGLNGISRAHVILFLSESFDGRKVWSSLENSRLVEKFCKKLIEHLDLGPKGHEETPRATSVSYGLSAWFARNFEECTTPRESDFHCILQLLKGKLAKDEWKYYPACVHGFGWILKQINYPFLDFEIDRVIPPALMFTDDYFDDYKILGLECLAHIVHNVSKVDLTRSNLACVVYEAVKNLCTDKDPVVIKLVMSILIKLLQTIEKDPARNSSEFTRYDSLIKQIIFQMEITGDLAVKKAWFPLLDDLLKICETATLHWSDRLCEMLRDSTASNDVFIWKYILQLTATLIRNTWIKVDFQSITEIVLRILINLSSFHSASLDENVKNDIIQNATECFKLLQSCDGFDEVDRKLKEIEENGNATKNLLHPEFISILSNVRLSATTSG